MHEIAARARQVRRVEVFLQTERTAEQRLPPLLAKHDQGAAERGEHLDARLPAQQARVAVYPFDAFAQQRRYVGEAVGVEQGGGVFGGSVSEFVVAALVASRRDPIEDAAAR